MSRSTARGFALAALTLAMWLVVADVSARLFEPPMSSLASMAGGGLVGIFLGIPSMLHLSQKYRQEWKP